MNSLAFFFTNPVAIGVLFLAGVILPDLFVPRKYEIEVVLAIWSIQAIGYFWYSDRTGKFKRSLVALLNQDYSEINQWKQDNPVSFTVLTALLIVLVLGGSLHYMFTPKNYSECMLDNMPGVDARARVEIRRACEELYPKK
jgi:hypothetical protein